MTTMPPMAPELMVALALVLAAMPLHTAFDVNVAAVDV